MKLVGLAFLIFALLKAADFLFAPVLLGFFYLKKKILRMDEAKWDIYFNKLSCGGYAVRFLIIYIFVLAFVCAGGYYLILFFEFKKPLFCTFVMFLIGILNAVVVLMRNKRKYLDEISRIM